MIAAAYCRKSTSQDGVAAEDKSVAFQLEHVRAFAKAKGWSSPDDLIFQDDGVSGAEFARRPGFVRLMAALKPRPPFGVLLMYDEDRLGREQIETAYALKQIVTAGVQVWTSKDGKQRTLDNPTDKVMLSLLSYANEMQRHATAERTRDGHIRKVRAGHVVGGTVYGYSNERVSGHVERRIVEAEAAVIQDIFAMATRGWGYRRIAHELNDRHAPAPKPRRTTTVGWSPSTVRDLLYRDLYAGRVIYGRRKKRDQWGQKRPTLRPKDEWLTLSAPELRICLSNVQRGSSVCTNTIALPMREVDSHVLSMLEGQLLDPDVLADAIAEAIKRIKGGNPVQARAGLVRRLAAIKKEVGNLTAAIAAGGGNIPSLVSALQERDQERAHIEADLARLDALDHVTTTKKDLTRDLEGALVAWRGLIRANVQQARQMISKLLAGKLSVTPNAAMTEVAIDGVGVVEPLLQQVVAAPIAGVTPAGFEPAFPVRHALSSQRRAVRRC